ncbi:hypothetical protein EOM89_13535 [Candidatus Falkowbacteria bacterium]|nr:hypothetical protein [Candidatus Falkowbacteria bacterium]
MANVNVLAGMRCPNSACRSDGPFRIECTTVFLVFDDGTDEHGDTAWRGDSYCACPDCGAEGTVTDFRCAEDADDADA